MAPSGPAISRAHARYVLFVLLLVYVFNLIDRQILAILLEPIKRDLQVSDTAMGFLTGFAFAVFYTLAGIPIARLSDRGDRRTIIAVGLATWSFFTAASGLARSYAQLALARVLVGVGEASASPASHSLISDYFPPERRATAMAIFTMGAQAGILLGLALGGYLQDAFGWRTAFFVVGLPGLAMAAVVRFTVREPPRGYAERRSVEAAPPAAGDVFRYLWSLATFRHVSLAAAFYSLSIYSINTWAPAFLVRVHGMSYTEVGLYFGVIAGGVGGLGAYVGGTLCDRMQARDTRFAVWIPAVGGLIAIPFAITFLFWPEPRAGLLFYAPAALFCNFYNGLTWSITQGLAKLRMRALASALVLFILNLVGLGFGPLAIGMLNDLLTPRFADEAIRYSLLLLVVGANLWGASHWFRAARSIRADFERARSLE